MATTTTLSPIPAPDKPPRPRRWIPVSLRMFVGILALPTIIGALLAGLGTSGRAGEEVLDARPAKPPSDRFAPYATDPDHLWNRLHRALFVRVAADGSRHIHSIDPLLYRGSTFLLEGEPHRLAASLLDEFLLGPEVKSIDDPLQRLVFQRDLWAAFDNLAWYPDEWVHHSRHEPATVALRTRLAKVIGHLALSDSEFNALPDNYALAVESKQFPATHDPQHPERPFLPTDLFDFAGPWVRFHETTPEPMTPRHFDGAGGRAVHIVFLNLPAGREATEKYLRDLPRGPTQQFPPGTMVAMVRRALAVDRSAKVRVTPVTELVQLRVYRRIPEERRANLNGDFGEQDVYEFVLDRGKLFAGQHGLRSVGPDEPAESFARSEGDPFVRNDVRPAGQPVEAQLKSCIQCHQAPGIFSVASMARGLQKKGETEFFRTYAWDVELKFTVRAKVKQFDWGLLRGLLEAQRVDGANGGEKSTALP
jgi:hypothetical protein